MKKNIVWFVTVFLTLTCTCTILYVFCPLTVSASRYKDEQKTSTKIVGREKISFLYTYINSRTLPEDVAQKLKVCRYKNASYSISFKKGLSIRVDRKIPSVILHNNLLDQYGAPITACRYNSTQINSIENDETFLQGDIMLFIREVLNKIYYINRSVLVDYQIYLYTTDNREIYYGQLDKIKDKNKMLNSMAEKNWKKLDVSDGKIILFTEQ